jgi:hypothetical protein
LKLHNRLRANEGSRLGDCGAGYAALIQPLGAAGEILRSAPKCLRSSGLGAAPPQEINPLAWFVNTLTNDGGVMPKMEVTRRTADVADDEDDPALEPFLRLLGNEIEAHPERLRGMPVELYRWCMAVVADVEVDADETFDGAICL